jgi:hypothetical protein
VLAEFWADGPNSETPPGHWFTILNYVNDYPGFQKRFQGTGPVLDDLEWDVKAYLVLGGAVHDAAIACWSIKGWYDYVRPISAIRWMADRGQSSSPALPHYSPVGLPLIAGRVELVGAGDPLAGAGNVNLNKIKLMAWRGPNAIAVPATDTAGVGWILAENWWPYQRPTFVTPPFAGYTSGHSTYSRAAAEVLTSLTGDEYFPGGMAEFLAPRNAFLVFEDGPSVDVRLQWATYRDASDQCSLSRIWGGIHAPQDDIPARLIGKRIGQDAMTFAIRYFTNATTGVRGGGPRVGPALVAAYPNPSFAGQPLTVEIEPSRSARSVELFDVTGHRVSTAHVPVAANPRWFKLPTVGLPPGIYLVRAIGPGLDVSRRVVIVH